LEFIRGLTWCRLFVHQNKAANTLPVTGLGPIKLIYLLLKRLLIEVFLSNVFRTKLNFVNRSSSDNSIPVESFIVHGFELDDVKQLSFYRDVIERKKG
jgi:hypothetical protein